MASFRLKKIESLIKEELSLIFLHKLRDPKLGLVTVTGVKLSPDLKIAKVYLSVFEKENREEILNKVNDINSMIRTLLAKKIYLNRVPELKFFIDDTQDYVEKMDDLFKKIKNDNEG
jgi:ribosome-binding factor A